MSPLQLALVSLVLCAISAQQGSAQQTSGTLLSLPIYEKCRDRYKQWQFAGKWYHFSWDNEAREISLQSGGDGNIQPQTTGKKVNWLEARNDCRTRCMDAVSMETASEDQMVQKFIKDRNVTYIWTSGRLCDFDGCAARTDLHPVNLNGWFWSATNQKISPTNKQPPGWSFMPWSQTGHTKAPQPDNAEFDINQTAESCLGVLNNLYQDGIKWHDIACYHPKPFICEDNQALLDYIKGTNKEQALRDNFN